MRKLAIAMALASTALATPAVARDQSWYFGVEGGAMIVEDMDLDVFTFDNAINVDYKTGLDVDFIAGYDFGAVRAEAEVAYKRASVDEVNVTRAALVAPFGTVGGGVGTFAGGGRATALSSMLNLLLDFGDDDGFNGYVGGGIGVARVKYNNFSAGTFAPFLDDKDSGLAWQGIAGVRTAISPNLDLGLKYRFFNVRKLDLIDEGRGVSNNATRNVNTRWRSHSLLASLIFNFGAPLPPPLPPVIVEPAPPPPPPPATQTCPDGSVILATDICPAPPPPPPPPEPEPVRG